MKQKLLCTVFEIYSVLYCTISQLLYIVYKPEDRFQKNIETNIIHLNILFLAQYRKKKSFFRQSLVIKYARIQNEENHVLTQIKLSHVNLKLNLLEQWIFFCFVRLRELWVNCWKLEKLSHEQFLFKIEKEISGKLNQWFCFDCHLHIANMTIND